MWGKDWIDSYNTHSKNLPSSEDRALKARSHPPTIWFLIFSPFLIKSSCRDQVAQARNQSIILINSFPLTCTPNPSASSASSASQIYLKRVPPLLFSIASTLGQATILPGLQSPLCSPSTVTRMVFSFKRQTWSCQRSSSWTPPPITAPLGLGFVALTGLPLRYSQSAHLANWLEFVLVGSGCHKVLHIGFRQQKLIFSPFGKSGVWGPRLSWADFFYHLSPWCVGDQLLQSLPSMHACVLTSSSYKDTAVLG